MFIFNIYNNCLNVSRTKSTILYEFCCLDCVSLVHNNMLMQMSFCSLLCREFKEMMEQIFYLDYS